MTRFYLRQGLAIAVGLAASLAWADSVELKNGSLINGKFMGGTENEISFQVGSSLQKYSIADVVSIKFEASSGDPDMPTRPKREFSDDHARREAESGVTIPAGTRIAVRTIDGIDSSRNRVGDRFQASLEEPLTVDGRVIADKGADVYGRLSAAKESGTFTGRSQLGLELTALVVNGQNVPIVTGDYELSGKSRGASTAKRTVGGAAVGSIIGAIAGGGKGAAIGAGVGAGVGAGSEIITKGDQVKVPSETLLDFTLQQDAIISAVKN